MGDMADWQFDQMTQPCDGCGEMMCDCDCEAEAEGVEDA